MKPSRFLQLGRPLLWVSGGLLLLIIIGYLTLDVVYANRIMPGTMWGSHRFGGLSFQEAEIKIAGLITEAQTTKLNFIDQADHLTYSLNQLGVEFDPAMTVARWRDFGRSANLLTNLRERVGGWWGLLSPKVAYQFNDQFDLIVSQLSKKYDQPAVNAVVVIADQQAIPRPAQPGRALSATALRQLVSDRLLRLTFSDVQLPIVDSAPSITTDHATTTAAQINQSLSSDLSLTVRGREPLLISQNQLWQWLEISPNLEARVLVARLKPTELAQFVQGLEPQINQPMQNAIFRMSGSKLVAFQPDRPGRVLRVQDAAQTIQQGFLDDERTIELAVNYLDPKTQLANLNDLGVNELVVTGMSNFAGSPTNRRHNIKIGAAKFNNIMVAPAETFSFNKVLGVVDQTTGYRPELVIKGDETVPEFGGGLCQVSTTAFRAILNGGYPVMERQNHSYRVVYYEPAGTDATIYPPSPDLKFINDSPGYIVIQTRVEGDNLYFDFYGTKMSRRVVLEGPKIFNVTAPPEPVYIETSTIPEGATKQIDTAHRGADAVLYRRIYDANGKEIRKEEFKSHYVPWPAKFLVGVKEAAPISTDLKNIPPESSGSEEALVGLTPPEPTLP